MGQPALNYVRSWSNPFDCLQIITAIIADIEADGNTFIIVLPQRVSACEDQAQHTTTTHIHDHFRDHN